MNFYKIKEAAAAIAAEFPPAGAADNGNDPRADAERCYLTALQHAVSENEIVYRDPDSRLPIRQDGVAAVMTAQWCVISVADLNAWLQAKGVGIQIPCIRNGSDVIEESDEAPNGVDVAESDWPTSAKLADDLGPYLVDGRDSEWLKRRLNDADRYSDLLKFRRMEGKKPVARWNAGGVAVYLVDSKELTWRGAKAGLEKHYPGSLGVLDGLGQREEKVASQWFPTAIH